MRQYVEAWNDHDTDAIVDFVSEEFDPYALEEFRGIPQQWFAAFADLSHEIKALATGED